MRLNVKDCPCCGSSDIGENGDEKFGVVFCRSCGLSTTKHLTYEESRELWQSRAQPEGDIYKFNISLFDDREKVDNKFIEFVLATDMQKAIKRINEIYGEDTVIEKITFYPDGFTYAG